LFQRCFSCRCSDNIYKLWKQHEKLKSMQVNLGLQITYEVRRS